MPNWKEQVAPDEEERFNRYAAEIREMTRTRDRGGPSGRALHLKPHLGAVGQLTVGELPAHLRVGPFAQPKSWPLYARFSNGTGARQHDGVADIRGVALKLVGVPGKKLIPGLTDKLTQDFLLIQQPAFTIGTPDDFIALLRIAAKGKALLPLRLLGHFGLVRGLQIIKGFATMTKVTSMATGRFHTATPIRFGDHAAKLDLLPLATPPAAPPRGRDALRDELVARLQAGPVEYLLRAQLFVDEATTPIEDATVVWPESKSPFVELGRVTLPRQDASSPRGKEIEALVEKLSFDPWHALEELRPLGAVMRARSAAYRESVIERKAAEEPAEVLTPG